MIIVNISGGIGNQMFQYSFGRYLSILFKKDLFLNKTAYEIINYRAFGLDSFTLPSNCYIGNSDDLLTQNMNGSELIQLNERFFHFDRELVKMLKQASRDITHRKTSFLISGYWQSAKYFEEIKETIRADFGFLHLLNGEFKAIQDKMKSENSVMIHIRRGDYLIHHDKYCIVSKAYIINAIQYYKQKLSTPVFYVFSDDISWCMNNLEDIEGLTFISDKFYDERSKSYLQLMCSCNYFIISNSTYSWWASWLGINKNKLTIAPKLWFADKSANTKDLYDASWIKI